MKQVFTKLAAFGGLSMFLAQTALADQGGNFTVPVPGTLALVGVAAAAAVLVLRRKK